jgi:hypothetical protein
MAITVEKVVAKKQTREFIRFPYTPAELKLMANDLTIAVDGKPAGVSLTMPDFAAGFKGPKEGSCLSGYSIFSKQRKR